MDNDAVMDALEKLKDWAMERMLASGEAPDGDTGDKPPDPSDEKPVTAEIEIEAMPMDDMEDDDEEYEDKPKNTVISRHFVGGGMLPRKSGKAPVSRR